MDPRRYNPLELDGFVEAVASERLIRDAAFLVDRESIAGFEVFPMSLRHYLALRLLGNPILLGQEPDSLEQLAQFIWTVSVDFKTGGQTEWMRKSGLILPDTPWLRTNRAMLRWADRWLAAADLRTRATTEAMQYAKDSLMDAPKGPARFHESYYSEACFWCSFMWRERQMIEEVVIEMPMKKLFQYYREAKERANGKAAMSNPSDEIKAKWQREQAQLRTN